MIHQEGTGQGTILVYARSTVSVSVLPLNSQLEKIIEYVKDQILSKASPRSKENGIRKIFIDDSVSGTVAPEMRPGFKALMEKVKMLSADGRIGSSVQVVVYDETRISRLPVYVSRFKNFLENFGATLHVLTD